MIGFDPMTMVVGCMPAVAVIDDRVVFIAASFEFSTPLNVVSSKLFLT